MPDLINKAKDLVGKHEDKKATPGDGIERKADDFANQQANNIAGREGVPQQDDGMLDKAVDAKVNEKIPGGN